MIKQQQNQPKIQQKSTRLSKFIFVQRTLGSQYQIIKQMLNFLKGPKQEKDYNDFLILYKNFWQEMKQLSLFQVLNYTLWNNEDIRIDIREKTEFFQIVSEWILLYQLKVGGLKNMQAQIKFISDFFEKQTKNMFDKVVLFDEIYEDLSELLGQRFWNCNALEKVNEQQSKQKEAPTKQESEEILKFLGNLVIPYTIVQSGKNTKLYDCQLYLLRDKSTQYKQFILKCLEYVLCVNGGKKNPQKYLEKYQQMELTKLALIFLQRTDLAYQDSVRIIKLLMLRTSKVVRLAMVVDYVRYYDFIQKTDQHEIIEQLENMVYFRQLIIGRVQIDEAGLISKNLSKPLTSIQISARSKKRILFSHQNLHYGPYSILQLQVFIEGGDINLVLLIVRDGKIVEYWKQDRTQDRRVDIILKQQGLYILEFNNTYSWVKSKNISYRLEQICIGNQANQV